VQQLIKSTGSSLDVWETDSGPAQAFICLRGKLAIGLLALTILPRRHPLRRPPHDLFSGPEVPEKFIAAPASRMQLKSVANELPALCYVCSKQHRASKQLGSGNFPAGNPSTAITAMPCNVCLQHIDACGVPIRREATPRAAAAAVCTPSFRHHSSTQPLSLIATQMEDAAMACSSYSCTKCKTPPAPDRLSGQSCSIDTSAVCNGLCTTPGCCSPHSSPLLQAPTRMLPIGMSCSQEACAHDHRQFACMYLSQNAHDHRDIACAASAHASDASTYGCKEAHDEENHAARTHVSQASMRLSSLVDGHATEHGCNTEAGTRLVSPSFSCCCHHRVVQVHATSFESTATANLPAISIAGTATNAAAPLSHQQGIGAALGSPDNEPALFMAEIPTITRTLTSWQPKNAPALCSSSIAQAKPRGIRPTCYNLRQTSMMAFFHKEDLSHHVMVDKSDQTQAEATGRSCLLSTTPQPTERAASNFEGLRGTILFSAEAQNAEPSRRQRKQLPKLEASVDHAILRCGNMRDTTGAGSVQPESVAPYMNSNVQDVGHLLKHGRVRLTDADHQVPRGKPQQMHADDASNGFTSAEMGAGNSGAMWANTDASVRLRHRLGVALDKVGASTSAGCCGAMMEVMQDVREGRAGHGSRCVGVHVENASTNEFADATNCERSDALKETRERLAESHRSALENKASNNSGACSTGKGLNGDAAGRSGSGHEVVRDKGRKRKRLKAAMGVRAMWIADEWRHKGIGCALLDTARRDCLVGLVPGREEVAWAEWLPDLLPFAAKYCGGHQHVMLFS
jgi:hypothetical protein